ncbi:glycosyl hydrolase [Agromyces sp. ZXT2-6]|uniref:glycosyl hydrolase n=1 Tax=Agromyces sp. ZXT2-6 TaxID=3461153 RepID=UPI004054BB54
MDAYESTRPSAGGDALWEAFVDPPDEARPRAWWHWMDGNVDPVGIDRDLRWMHATGLRGAQVFDGGMGGSLVVPSAVRPGTPDWNEAVDTAVATANELAMELAVATSSGWSASGGPWVAPADAMKKVVWSERDITGGSPVDVVLPPLPAVPGAFQDCPRWGADGTASGFAVDWCVLAFPAAASRTILAPTSVHASSPLDDVACLTDGAFGPVLQLPRDPDHHSSAWIEQEFDEATTVRSVTVGLPGPHGFGAAPPADAVLQVSDDGIEYRDVAVLPPSAVPSRTVSFSAVTARRFRLVLSAASAAEALPPVAPGVRLPPVLRKSDAFHVSEFALRSAGRVHFAEAKAGFGVVSDYHAVPTPEAAAVGAIDPASVLDVTDHVSEGVLRWTPPPGEWAVLRLGGSLTGQTNGPAPADATGLEVDKLDGARVRAYLDTHLERFGVERDGAASGAPRFSALLSDSIEAGSQNWTDAMAEHLRRLRGYDPTSWLPALTGLLVGTPDDSDRFLYDYRRTIAELYADEYYGTLAAEAHRRGMAYYAEALEDGRPQLGDDLAMRAPADVPMGAMWTFDPAEGPRPTYVADLKGAASVAHVHGRRWIGAEAFTSFDRPWSWTPRTLKHVADLQLALGVTRFCIHTSPHQPIAAPAPGIALAPFLGQAFTVHETWSGMAREWMDYLARCSAVLAAGTAAVDVAVFVGEEAPVTGLFEHRLDDAVPPGFDFDYVGPDALRDVLRVEADAIRSKGASYRALYLGGSSERMTLPTLRAIERLLDAGATVIGTRPTGTPSLADDPDEFDAACERIWSTQRARGRVVGTSDLADALRGLGWRPALEIDGTPVRRIAREIDGRRVTFVANPSGEPIELRLRTPEPGTLVAWDPVEVRRAPIERPPGDDAHVIALEPFGSVFVVASPEPRDDAVDAPARTTTLALAGEWTIELPGRSASSVSPGPRLWADADADADADAVDGGRGFSGVGTYRMEFDLAERPTADRLVLHLGTVRDIARVRLNDLDCGVAWTEPFRLDVTAAVRPGRNVLEVDVATPWRNRLIAEADSPSGGIPSPLTTVFEPTAEPLRAGLAGPVTLIAEWHD